MYRKNAAVAARPLPKLLRDFLLVFLPELRV